MERPERLLQAPYLKYGDVMPKSALAAQMYVTNLLAGTQSRDIHHPRVDAWEMKDDGSCVLKIVHNEAGGLWGQGMADFLDENGCRSLLVVDGDSDVGRSLVVVVPRELIARVERDYRQDIDNVADNVRRRALAVVLDDEEDEKRATALVEPDSVDDYKMAA